MIKQAEIIFNIELTKNDIFFNVFNKDCHNCAARTTFPEKSDDTLQEKSKWQ